MVSKKVVLFICLFINTKVNYMLKHIDSLLHAELLFSLQNMGHGDTLAIVDANFPAYSLGSNTVVNLTGVDCSTVMKSILKHLPLDEFTDHPLSIMAQDNSDQLTDAAQDFIKMLGQSEEKGHAHQLIDRFDFYSKTKECQLVISTSDLRPYACMLLQKGVIFE